LSTATIASPPRRGLVLADAIPGARVRDAALVLGGAAFTALLAQLSINVPGSPVPITGQTLAVGLVGATLGFRRGTAAMLLYALLGLVLPVYADGASGWDVVWGANGGYIVGFVIATAVIGLMAERGADRKALTAFVAFALAQVLVFGFGLVGLKLATDESWGWVVHNGFTIFIVGGLVKAAIGAAVLPSAWSLVRRFERR
jgi:biotin transport system substrate-specific component